MAKDGRPPAAEMDLDPRLNNIAGSNSASRSIAALQCCTSADMSLVREISQMRAQMYELYKQLMNTETERNQMESTLRSAEANLRKTEARVNELSAEKQAVWEIVEDYGGQFVVPDH
eukprot:gene9381-11116_t